MPVLSNRRGTALPAGVSCDGASAIEGILMKASKPDGGIGGGGAGSSRQGHSGDGGKGDGPVILELAIVPSTNQVVFPPMRCTLDLSKDDFEQVCEYFDSSGNTLLGVVTVKSSSPGGDPEYCEVGTLCRFLGQAQPEGQQQLPGPKGAGPTSRPREKSEVQGGSSHSDRVRIAVQGQSRFRVLEYTKEQSIRWARVELIEGDDEMQSSAGQDVETKALVQSVHKKLLEFIQQVSQEKSGSRRNPLTGAVSLPTSPSALVGVVGFFLQRQLSLEEKQTMLETMDIKSRLRMALEWLQRELETKRMGGIITAGIQKSREAELRYMMLQKQMQDVQEALRKLRRSKAAHSSNRDEAGDNQSTTDDGNEEEEDEPEDEVVRLKERLDQAGLPDDATRIVNKELRRLKTLQPHHPEYTGTHTYLELVASLPWSKSSEDRFDLKQARAMLDEDHKGLHKVKMRLLEFLAVQKMRGDMKGPILCLHGPPGIGKTSLGRSVARALGRKFHRLALGGVKDESEIRGHRRTYIGSMCGSIIQAFQTAGTNNPVILLDEVDKMSRNSMFNPQATLLEVLDPEQNSHFKDHYLNTPFDLSRALFICTANDSSLIDRPLLDRMEVVNLSGYTLEEKVSISESHLLPKQLSLHALDYDHDQPAQTSASQEPLLQLTQEATRALITKWTSESGVRNLERLLAQLCRWAALRLQATRMVTSRTSGDLVAAEKEAALESSGPDERGIITVDADHLKYILGPEAYEEDLAGRLDIGVAMGLSVSATGGQLLFIEATRACGSGKLQVTGQLGSVMNESVQTALSLLRSRFVRSSRLPGSATAAGSNGSDVLSLLYSRKAPGDVDTVNAEGADRDPFKGEDIHVHFPAGGIPKDGPSAGVAILLALASVLLDRPMRSDMAVTGEVTLRGHVLPVGGIRDKVLAAHRAGVKHVLLPLANKRNVMDELPAKTLETIQVHYMKHIDEALDFAFGRSGGVNGDVRQHDDSVASQTGQSDFSLGVPAAMAMSATMSSPLRIGALNPLRPPYARL